jgi:nucleoid-associated protein YgaU
MPAFAPSSRYARIPTAQLETADRRTIVYLRRRFLPRDPVTAATVHRVVQADRLDNLAARYLGDPELFWRLADANGAMRPEDLTAEVGRLLTIPLPTGS